MLQSNERPMLRKAIGIPYPNLGSGVSPGGEGVRGVQRGLGGTSPFPLAPLAQRSDSLFHAPEPPEGATSKRRAIACGLAGGMHPAPTVVDEVAAHQAECFNAQLEGGAGPAPTNVALLCRGEACLALVFLGGRPSEVLTSKQLAAMCS